MWHHGSSVKMFPASTKLSPNTVREVIGGAVGGLLCAAAGTAIAVKESVAAASRAFSMVLFPLIIFLLGLTGYSSSACHTTATFHSRLSPVERRSVIEPIRTA